MNEVEKKINGLKIAQEPRFAGFVIQHFANGKTQKPINKDTESQSLRFAARLPPAKHRTN